MGGTTTSLLGSNPGLEVRKPSEHVLTNPSVNGFSPSAGSVVSGQVSAKVQKEDPGSVLEPSKAGWRKLSEQLLK